MSLFPFLLFLLLGWMAFVPPADGSKRTVLLVIYVVIMLFWLLAGITGFDMTKITGR